MPEPGRFLLERFPQCQPTEANFLGAGPVVYDALVTDSNTSSCDFVRSLTPDEHSPTPAIVTIGPCSSDHFRNGTALELRSDDDDNSDYAIPGPDMCTSSGHDLAGTDDDYEASRRPSSGTVEDSTLGSNCLRPGQPSELTDKDLCHIPRNSPAGSSLASGLHAENLDFLRRHFSSGRTRRISDNSSYSGNETT